MDCPTCHQVTLLARERLGFVRHHCPNCRGVWLERQAIAQLSEQTGLFLKTRASPALRSASLGERQPLWKELFDVE